MEILLKSTKKCKNRTNLLHCTKTEPESWEPSSVTIFDFDKINWESGQNIPVVAKICRKGDSCFEQRYAYFSSAVPQSGTNNKAIEAKKMYAYDPDLPMDIFNFNPDGKFLNIEFCRSRHVKGNWFKITGCSVTSTTTLQCK